MDTTTKKPDAAMWEEIYEIVQDARLDEDSSVRTRIIKLGERNQWTEQELIDAKIITERPRAEAIFPSKGGH